MKHLILNHTPMDDYQKMIKQAYYTIESDEEYICKPDNNKEKLKNNKAYRYIAVAIKTLLILAGIMVIGTVAIFCSCINPENPLYCAIWELAV